MKIQLNNFANFRGNPYNFKETIDNPKYWMRSPNISDKKVRNFLKYIKSEDINNDNNKLALESLNKICKSEESAFIVVGQARNYKLNDYGLYTDPFMMHECLGLMTYSKKYQIIYNLNENLAEIIALLTNDNVDRIKQVLLERLQKDGIDYTKYSMSILGQYSFNKTYSLDYLLKLVPELDQIIKTQRCYLLNHCCSIHSKIIEDYDEEHDIPALLDKIICSILHDVQQCILDAVFLHFEEYKVKNNSRAEAVTSNGSGCLVVQANNLNVAEDIELYTHDGTYIGSISPYINDEFSYAKTYIEKLVDK